MDANSLNTYENLTYRLDGGVAVIGLHDPKKLNALSPAMAGELLTALRRAEQEARAILLKGEGRAFSSGADLAAGNFDPSDPARDAGARLEDLYNPVILQMRQCRQPIVTAMRGAVVGVACGLALSGDLIISSESGFFLLSFSRVGLGPDAGVSYLLTRSIGRARAMEMVLLGERLPAAKALEWGLINRVYPDDVLDDEALALAHNLAKGPYSLGNVKKIMWDALDSSMEVSLSRERFLQRENSRSNDFAEGLYAFRESRAPRFLGQ